MKKLVAMVSALAMAASLVGCGSSTAAETTAAESGVSGTFTGEGVGMGGADKPVTVSITLENSVITDVTVEAEGETEGIGTKAMESMPEAMKESGSIAVDGVSGATLTSNAILDAAAAAITAAGLNPEDYKKVVETSAEAAGDVEKEADIVIVGAGGAGMVAAITAADEGKSVIVLESQAMVGGNSVRSTGGMNAAKTVFQDENEFAENSGVEKTLANAAKYEGENAEVIKELAATVQEQYDAYQANPEGYFDSSELFELDTMIGGKGLNDFALVQTLVEESPEAIDWLDSIGATLHNVAQFGGASVKRIHRPVDAEGKTLSVGAYVVPILEKNLEDRGIELLTETTATEIIMDGDKAVGVVAEAKDGSKVTVNAKAVVLTAGGFGANNEMVAEQNASLDGYISTNAPGILGQGIKMAVAVGADTVDMNQIQLHPTVHVAEDGSANLITEGLRGDGAILVNQEGERFFDEVSTRDKVSAAENEQTGGYAWLIIDEAMYEKSNVIKGYVSKGFALQGDDAAALAAELDMDGDALAATIEKWNACVEAKEDADFGRTSFDHQLEGTLYAIKVQPGVHHTMGGLKIDTTTEVLNADGNAIAGLFAAGEITGGVHGANRLGGNAVADFSVFGRIAGKSASEYVAK